MHEWVRFLSHVSCEGRNIINEHTSLLAAFTHVATVNQSTQQHAVVWEHTGVDCSSGQSPIFSTKGSTGVQLRHQGDRTSSTTSGHQGSLLYLPAQSTHIDLLVNFVTVTIQIITAKLPFIIVIYVKLQLGWGRSNTGRIQGVHHFAIHHWKADVLSILQMGVYLWYHVC